VLTWNDAPIKDNTIGAIVVDSILENVFYEGEFDPDVPQPPTCFAFGRDDKTMEPHKTVVEAGQSQAAPRASARAASGTIRHRRQGPGQGLPATCAAWACWQPHSSTRRALHAVRPPGGLRNAAFGFLKIPVTSVRGYAPTSRPSPRHSASTLGRGHQDQGPGPTQDQVRSPSSRS